MDGSNVLVDPLNAAHRGQGRCRDRWALLADHHRTWRELNALNCAHIRDGYNFLKTPEACHRTYMAEITRMIVRLDLIGVFVAQD
jgi:hypothetical protein